jgi:phage FluMu protein Com
VTIVRLFRYWCQTCQKRGAVVRLQQIEEVRCPSCDQIAHPQTEDR